MPLPVCRKLLDFEIERLFDDGKHIGIDYDPFAYIDKTNPRLFQLCKIAKKYEQEEKSDAYIKGACIIYSLLSDAAKPNKLPVVSQATVDSTIASFFGEKDDFKKSRQAYLRMFHDPTLLMCLIYIIETETLSEDEKNWMGKAFAQFYEMLYRQAEADDMEEMFT